jgi:hypothetical protein
MLPFQLKQDIPVPAPTAPRPRSPDAREPPTEWRAAASADATSSYCTCMRRASVSHESSHSPTIAIAAQALRDADFGKVAVIDIDAHHGNGTQAIFYERPDVFTASVHFDPGAGWFPHHVGFADETGRDTGFGTNLNLLTSVSPP